MSKSKPSLTVAYSCLTALVALYVVGAVSNGSLRHEVQTLPLWVPIVLGFRRHELAKWTALPCLLIWLILMINIWLFLLGLPHLLSGTFSPVEIAMTIAVGGASLLGIITSFLWRTSTRVLASISMLVLLAALQLAAIRISVIPYIARR